jgi:predicted metal-dependent phosphoesterase TrpH
VEARFKKDVMQNVNVQSRLNLFNNYTDKNISNRRNMTLTGETAINMKVNQYIAASLIIHMIYDDDIDIPVTRTVDSVRVSTTTGPRYNSKQP